MKQIQTIIALTLLCTTANAQNIQGSYQPKADGMVSKQQVANRSESPLIYMVFKHQLSYRGWGRKNVIQS